MKKKIFEVCWSQSHSVDVEARNMEDAIDIATGLSDHRTFRDLEIQSVVEVRK